MNISLIVFLFFKLSSHDVQVAFYNLHQVDGNFEIDFDFEKDDVLSTFNEMNIQLSDKNLQEYINDNFILLMDDTELRLSFEEMQLEDKHILLKGITPKGRQTFKYIEIHNTCFINIEDHSNILEIRLQGQERDFLMNKDRTTINIEY